MKLSRFHGNVSTVSLDGSSEKSAELGFRLQPGQVVQTGWNSMAELEVDGQSLVRLGPNTSLSCRKEENGLTLSLLRGSALWQVYQPGAGPLRLVTPSAQAVLPTRGPSVTVATVQLTGESDVEVLACGIDGVPARSLPTGETVSLRAGQRANFGVGTLSPIRFDVVSVSDEWNGAAWGAVLGGLHDGAERAFAPGGMAGFTAGLVGGTILSSVTIPAGLQEVTLPFKEQSLEAVAYRVTPLGDSVEPVVIVKAGLFGLYDLQACTVTYKGQPLVSAPPPATGAPLKPSRPGLASPSAPPPPAGTKPALPPPPQANIPTAPAVGIAVPDTATPQANIPVAPAVGIAVPEKTPPAPFPSPPPRRMIRRRKSSSTRGRERLLDGKGLIFTQTRVKLETGVR